MSSEQQDNSTPKTPLFIYMFYLSKMVHEDTLLQNYRTLFIALQAILFGFSIALLGNRAGEIIWLGIAGIVFIIAWILICHFRARELDAWRAKLMEVTKGTDVGAFLYGRWGTSKVIPLARYTFNYAVPALLLIAWILLIVISF